MSNDYSREIRNILERLTPQEHAVLRAKFGIVLDLNTPHEQLLEAIAHIASEKIKAIESGALEKIRGNSRPQDGN